MIPTDHELGLLFYIIYVVLWGREKQFPADSVVGAMKPASVSWLFHLLHMGYLESYLNALNLHVLV